VAFDRRRYTRQVRLPEIGEAGQARLCAAKVTLATDGFARSIEERYLRASGVDPIEPVGGSATAMPLDLGLRHEAAREVADGALRALVAIRAVLGIADEGKRDEA
jgi:hypothetical protein